MQGEKHSDLQVRITFSSYSIHIKFSISHMPIMFTLLLSRYHVQSVQSCEYGILKNDVFNKPAKLSLSIWGYEIWKKESNILREYEVLPQEDGTFHVCHPQYLERAPRIIPSGGRCPCQTRVSLLCQCRHEICLHEHKFVKELWAIRWHQREGITRSSNLGVNDLVPNQQGQSPIDVQDGDDNETAQEGNSANANNQDEDSDIIPPGGVESDDDSVADSTTLAQLATQPSPTGDDTSPRAISRANSYKVLMGVAQEVVAMAAGRHHEAMLGFLLKARAVFQQDASSAYSSLEKLANDFSNAFGPAEGNLFSQSSGDGIVPLPSQVTHGRPNEKRLRKRSEQPAPRPGLHKKGQCGFCKMNNHNISHCQAKKQWGIHVQEPHKFSSDLDASLTPLESLPVGDTRTHHDDLPRGTRFIVVHKCHLRNDKLVAMAATQIQNKVVEVTCLGEGGLPLSVSGKSKSPWERQLFLMAGVQCWISRHGQNQNISKVFSLLHEEGYQTTVHVFQSGASVEGADL